MPEVLNIRKVSDIENPPDTENQSYWGNGLLYKNGLVMLCAEPKKKKSFLAIDLAMHLSAGKDFLTFSVKDKIKTLYINLDDISDFWDKRLYDMKQSFDGDLSNFYEFKSSPIDITRPDTVNTITNTMRENDIKVLILDTFRRAHTLNENDSENATIIKSSLDTIQSSTGAAILLLHHLRKKSRFDEAGDIMSRIRGSGDFHSFGSSYIAIDQEKKRNRMKTSLYFDLKNGVEIDPLEVRFDDNMHFIQVGRDDIINLQRYIKENTGIMQCDLVQHMMETSGKSRSTIERELENYVKGGNIRRQKIGRFWHYV